MVLTVSSVASQMKQGSFKDLTPGSYNIVLGIDLAKALDVKVGQNVTLMLEREKAAPPMMVLDPADLPDRKSKPKRSLILALGLMIGFLGSCAAVLGWKIFVIPAPKG